jgi:spore germination cell wall hydrolase CwlJ-like protein
MVLNLVHQYGLLLAGWGHGANRGTACLAGLLAVLGAAFLPGCTGQPPGGQAGIAQTAAKSDERTCLVRAMYFVSNRSSRDGLMAVGTVVMNRVASPLYPKTICGVVGQPGQFAAGVLTRPLNARDLSPVERAADAILAGERYAPVGDAMHFHVAGLNIPYRVQYLATAGGNAFYLKTGTRRGDLRIVADRPPAEGVLLASASRTKETTFADAAPKSGVMRWLYATLAQAEPAKSCDQAATAFGATSLACEDEHAGR